MFITFEGIEGSGKSTQLELCAKVLTQKNIPFILTKEPGGTELGKTIRKWLLDPKTSFKHKYSEVLLFIADRLEHVETIIKPALNENKIVLCDRYKDSTTAYQLAGRQLDKTLISYLNNLTDLNPDLTLFYDCPVEVGLERAKNRAKLDRFEDEDIAFHTRIFKQYHKLLECEPKRFVQINANQDISTVHEKTLEVLSQHIKGI